MYSSSSRNPHVHISVQESYDKLSIIACLQLLTEPLDCASRTLGFRGAPVENHWAPVSPTSLGTFATVYTVDYMPNSLP